MIEVKINFDVNEAVNLFRDAGLTVERRDIEREFHAPHRPIEMMFIPTWIVVNPHTQEEELLEDCFQRHIKHKYKKLFLTTEKIDIYNLFTKKKK